MTALIIILIVFVFASVISGGNKAKKYVDFRKSNNSNCREQYRIGCSICEEMLRTYNECAVKNTEHLKEHGDNSLEGKYLYSIKSLCNIGSFIVIDKADLHDFFVYYHDSGLCNDILDYKECDFKEWIKSKYFNKGGTEWASESDYKLWLEQVHNFKKQLDDNLNGYKCKSTIDMVAEKYGLPTSKERDGTFLSNCGMSLGSLIYEYSLREIKKLGFTAGDKGFSHFKTNPTETDFQEAEKCDSYLKTIGRKYNKQIDLEKKYPWMK